MSAKHTPITNTPTTETQNTGEQLTPGTTGTGEVAAAAGPIEDLPRMQLEMAMAPAAELALLEQALPDIGIASFGVRAVPELVFGTDERVRVTSTTLYPWRAIASLLITARDDSQWIGTGWFVGPRTLITAGHCVYIKGSPVPGRDGWVKRIQVIPGRDGTTKPYGARTATEFWSVQGWGQGGEEAYDYGAIILPAAFPTDVGTFGFAVRNDAELKTKVVNVAGYPGDKPQGTLWHDFREIAQLTPDKVHYVADTAGGQSGAPAFLIEGQQRIAIGIHAYGGATTNSATRISTPAYTNILQWKNR